MNLLQKSSRLIRFSQNIVAASRMLAANDITTRRPANTNVQRLEIMTTDKHNDH